MSILASTRRRYLSNFLAIALAISGLQFIAVSSAPTASALTWTNVTGPTVRGDLHQIRTNNDGSVIGAVSKGQNNSNLGDLYLSRDSGASWTTTTGDRYTSNGLYRLAISGDGNMAIAGDDAYILRASYSGSSWSYSNRTWSNPTGSGTNQRCAGYGPNFNSFATSTDGSKWIGGARDEGCVYTSDNSGVDWSNVNLGGTHFGSAISADGTVRITSNSNGNLYRNSGSGWAAITTSGLPASTGWSGIACDSTCTKMAIYTWGAKVYTTSNSGANWSAGGSPIRNTLDLSMSSDGSVIAITDGAEIYISKDLGATWSSEGQTGKSWTGLTVSGNGRKIYAAARDGTIRKADILPSQTITFNDPLDMTYGGADQPITASSSSGLTVTLASTTTSVCTIVSNSIRIVTAGTCTVTANQAGDGLYAAAAQVSNNVTISKASSSISASGSTTFTYSGLPQGPASSTLVGSAGAVTYSYVGVAPTSYSASATKPTNAGSYSVTATVATDTNYLSATSAPYTFTISKSALEITASSPTVIYGAAKPSINAIYAGLVNGEATTVVTGLSCDTGYTTTSPAGSLPATSCSGGTASNYTISYVAGSITINPKALTISGISGVNKEFDRSVIGTASGTPTLVGVVGSDDVLLGGTPTFTFASTNVANGKTVTASGYTLTGTTASNYTLTQPTLSANITAKAARVAATNTTVAFGAQVTSGVTATGLISGDAIGSASYTYTGTGTSTPPTAVGVYTVTPSSALFSTGLISNYTITYDTATVTILAKYTITYNANGGLVSGGSTSSVDFVVGDNALSLPVPTRANYTFTGWYTLQTNGVQVTGAYTPTANATLWAHWVQNSLYGMGANTKILTITTLAGVGNTYSANAAGGTVAIEYLADALAAGTVIDAYVLSDTATATSLIGSGNDYVMSLVLAWVHPTTGLVETTATGKPITMTITNSVIKKGAKIYSVIGLTSTLLATATADGVAVISITDDPQIIIAITKPDAPTGVSATSGGNASTTVSWTAPSDGGSAITMYTATSNAGQTCSSATTSCSVTGLANGTSYTFTVTATNSIGTSDPSAPSSAITPVAPGAPVVTAPTSTVDPLVAAAAAAAKALADKVAIEAKIAAEAKALADKKAADEAELAAIIKALLEQAAVEAAAKKVADELAAAQLKAEEEIKAAAALKLAEEKRIAAALAASKKITTVYSTSAAFKLNTTYTKRVNTNTKKIAAGSTVTCIGYAKSSKTLPYAKAKVVATKQAKALCSSMKKINPTLKTKSIVYPASKAPKTTLSKKWIPVSYRVAAAIN